MVVLPRTSDIQNDNMTVYNELQYEIIVVAHNFKWDRASCTEIVLSCYGLIVSNSSNLSIERNIVLIFTSALSWPCIKSHWLSLQFGLCDNFQEPATCHTMVNLRKNHKKSQITLREKLYCEFAIVVARKTDSSSMLNKITNWAYKACGDWLNHFYSPWESAGFKVESQNDQLCLTWNRIWASLGTVIIAEQETIVILENQTIRGDSKLKSGWIYLRAAASWAWLWAQSPRTISNDGLTENRTPIRH